MHWLILALALIATGCTVKHPLMKEEECISEKAWYIDWSSKPPPVVDTMEASRAILTFSAELQHKFDLLLDNSFAFCDDKTDTINRFRLEYHTQRAYEVCSARELIVDVVEGFLKSVNDDGILAAKLTNAPLTANDLEIEITITSYYAQFTNCDMMGWIVLERGMVYFYAADVYDPHIDIFKARVEPYYKSLQYVTINREIKASEAEKQSAAPQGNIYKSTL